MRILMLSQSYPPIIGGVAIHTRTLSVELVARGHDVAVITLWHEGLEEYDVDQGVRVYHVRSSMQRAPWLFKDSKRPRVPPFPDPEIMLAMRRIIAHERPEIVHVHDWLVHSFLLLKAWSGAILIVSLHNYSLACPKMFLLYHGTPCNGPGFTKCLGCAAQHYGLAKGVSTVLANRLMSLVQRGTVDMFLPVSQATAMGSGLIGGRLPFQVIPNFLSDDISPPQDIAQPYSVQLPKEDYLLFVGALGRLKGVDVLLRVYKNLTHAPPLVLIGYETPEWPILARDCPDNVFVLKDWPRHAVMEAWRRCMIGLVPSVWAETFGLVAIEAMSMGCPVIASRTGGLIDLVDDEETGLLVEPANPVALQQAIERLLVNPDLRYRMGQAALRKVVDFKASTIVPRIEQVYQKVLQQRA